MSFASPTTRLLLVLTLALLALSPISLGASESELDEPDTNASFKLPKDTLVEKDISYGLHASHKLDIYRSASASNAPIILMVHGGGWAHGDKANDAVVQNKVKRWAARGLVFVSINYRLLTDAMPLAQADDVALALAFVQRHAKEWGGDGSRVILMGHSAGAHLVSLVTAAPEFAERAGAQSWLGTVALDSAVFDVEAIMKARHFRLYDKAFGDDATIWRSASPLHRLVAPAPPLLAVCSSRREISCAQAQAYAKRAHALGVRVQVSSQDKSHRQINEVLGEDAAYTHSVEQFLAGLETGLAKQLTITLP